MDCEKFGKHLDNFASLTDDEMLEVTSHAAKCERCAKELEFMLSVIDTARSLPDITAPADFMEQLNERIDEVEINRGYANRAIRGMRRNWKQYTALAACLALVAVLTANGKLLTDRFNGTDDGVIIDDTPNVSDTTAPVIPPELINEVTEPVVSENTNSEPTAQTEPARVQAHTPVRASQSSEPAVSAPTTAPTVVASVPSEPSDNGEDYGIQTMSLEGESGVETYSEEPVKSRMRSRSALTGYTLSGKQVTETAELEEPNVGRLKISPKDEKDAMETIMKYSYEVDGDYYTTSPDNMVNIFCDLVDRGVEYANYIPDTEDSIRFQLIIG